MLEEATAQESSKADERPLSSSLAFTADILLKVEKLRVAAQVRGSHLQRNGVVDTTTMQVRDDLAAVEERLTNLLAVHVKAHPAYHWFSRVKGVGNENIGKVAGLIAIERAPTVSSLWKFAGYHVEEGAAVKRVKGVKLAYNATLRTMCWRLGLALLRAQGRFYEYYLVVKAEEQAHAAERGLSVIPALKRPEREGEIYEGHIHNRALRRMVKLFLSLLWEVWRQAEGLPTPEPYALAQLGHGHLRRPEEFVDR